MAVATGAAKTKETMKPITAVAKATAGPSTAVTMTMTETTKAAVSAMSKAGQRRWR